MAAPLPGVMDQQKQAKVDQRSFAQLFSGSSQSVIPVKKPSSHKEAPAIFFSKKDINQLSSSLKLALVGKFSHGRPKLEEIRKFISLLDLKDDCQVGHMDARHVLIRCAGESDFHRLWARGLWYVRRFQMRVFKWTPNFHVSRESFLAPVWISLPGLPVHFFNKHSLFFIVNTFGRPLLIDNPMLNLTRPSVAHICVEVDLMRTLPVRIWLGLEDSNEGFWQVIEPENLPDYCSACWHLGHARESCQKSLDVKKQLQGKSTSTNSENSHDVHTDFVGDKKQWVMVSKQHPNNAEADDTLEERQRQCTPSMTARVHDFQAEETEQLDAMVEEHAVHHQQQLVEM